MSAPLLAMQNEYDMQMAERNETFMEKLKNIRRIAAIFWYVLLVFTFYSSMLSGYFHFGNNHIFVQFALFKDIFFVWQMVVVMYITPRLEAIFHDDIIDEWKNEHMRTPYKQWWTPKIEPSTCCFIAIGRIKQKL